MSGGHHRYCEMEFIPLHNAAKNISIKRYGRLVALGPVSVKKFASGANHVQWLCRCDCGNEKIISIAKFSTGNTKSCGCLQTEVRFGNKNGVRHGMHESDEYEIWHGMLARCRNENHRHFSSYGGRGIIVCERWERFENFYADMGHRPSSLHSLDRWPNNNGNYELSNCRWATRSQQQRNMRTNRIITAFGKTAPLIEFIPQGPNSREYNRARYRLNSGWLPEDAITERST